MSINRKLGDLANVLDDGTEGQVLSFNASGAIAAADIAAGAGGASVYDSAELLPLTGLSAGDMAYVTGTNRFYISNGTGWYSVSLVNTNPSITSVQDSDGGSTPFTLTTDGTATVITVTASDPEDVPLTYNYSVTSGSLTNGGGTTATVSQADNVFTVTPTTTEAYDGTFSLTFTASDGINTDTSSNSFTLQFITRVTNSRYTTLLATATGTSDNNNITDASSNSHSITVNGDAYAGTFSPYRSGGYSMYFDGGDYVGLGNGNLAINTEDFTIETWVNVTLGSTMLIANNSNWSAGSNTGWRALIMSGGLINITASQGTWNVFPSVYQSTNAIPSNEWAHVVICRDSGVISSYINGIKDPTTVNYSASLNQTGHQNSGSSLSSYSLIGAYIADGNEYNNLTGYLSDFHFKLGSAKYTTTFSPPTERLTVESGTDVLLFNKPFLKDESTNAYTTTISGDPKISPFSPYDHDEYLAADHGGSVYFDGSGDSLNTTATQIIPSTSFTVTAWVYLNDTTDGAVWGQGTSGHSGRTGISIDSGNWFAQIGSANLGTSTSVSANRWYYTDLQWDGSTLKFFVDGTLLGSVSNSNSPTNSAFYIGDLGSAWSTGYPLNGYVSDLKVVSGTPSGSSTVPTAPLSSSGASLHLKGADASIIDKSQGANLKLVGNTTGSTAQAKFANTKSMYFDGSGDYAQLSARLHLRSSDFTIETWIYQDTNAGSGASSHTIYSDWINANNDKSIILRITDSSGQKVQLLYSTDGTTNSIYTSTSSISNSTWTHVAVCKDSTSLRLYIDGVEEIWENNPAFTLNPNAGTIGPFIGGHYDTSLTSYGYFFDGYIQDFRITNGLARYTASFTPPTASLEG